MTRSLEQIIPHLAQRARLFVFGSGLSSSYINSSLREVTCIIRAQTQQPVYWHANRNLEAMLGLWLRWRYPCVRIIYTRHSDGIPSAITRLLMRRADAVISLTDLVSDKLPVPSTVIPHGVDTDYFSPDVESPAVELPVQQPNIIAVLGRVRREKGQHLVIEALAGFLQGQKDYALLIMGRVKREQEKYLQGLQQRVKEHGIEGQVYFCDEVKDPRGVYKQLKLVVVPSYSEGFSMVPLEAMAMGVPVIASRGVGIHSQLIRHGENGWLFQPGEAADLCAVFESIELDSSGFDEIRTRLRGDIEQNWSAQREAERILQHDTALA